MADTKAIDGRKWINGIVALGAIVCAFYMILFIGQLGEWFDLEAKVNNFKTISQGAVSYTHLTLPTIYSV